MTMIITTIVRTELGVTRITMAISEWSSFAQSTEINFLIEFGFEYSFSRILGI